MTEQHSTPFIETVIPAGEAGVHHEETLQLFAVDQAQVAEICPSAEAAASAWEAFYHATNPKEFTEADDESSKTSAGGQSAGEDIPALDRRTMRENMGIYGSYFRRLAQTGAYYAASYDDQEEGLRVAHAILTESMGDVFDALWNRSVVPAVPHLRNTRVLSNEVAAQALAQEDVSKRYTLLKALSLSYGKKVDADKGMSFEAWPPGKMVFFASVLAESPLKDQLCEELGQGVFDRHIAQDLLRFVSSGAELEPEHVKVRQLVTFLDVFAGRNEHDVQTLEERMVACLADWPADQLHAVVACRDKLRSGLELNWNSTARRLKNNRMIGDGEDLQANFESALGALAMEFLKRVTIDNENKAEIMRIRAKLSSRKRRPKTVPEGSSKAKKSKKKPAEEVSELPPEPLKLITCNLNDNTTVEGIDALIENFMDRTVPGDTALREDLKRMATFMARTDLPPAHRRGFKTIQGAKVRFGEDNKQWPFFEFKPTDAAGLSLRTAIAKDSRIYFIKLSASELGVFGLEPRAEQSAFLSSVRIKTKKRG